MTPIDSIVARLTALHPKRIDLSLERIERLLAALGSSGKKLPPVIHVAGTNGKGSTIAFLRAMLEAAGKRVHVYTSPHLVRFNERFRLGAPGEGKLVSDDELAATLDECERVNAGAAHHRVRDHHRGRPPAVRAPSRRRAAAGGRARRPARRHQCDRCIRSPA